MLSASATVYPTALHVVAVAHETSARRLSASARSGTPGILHVLPPSSVSTRLFEDVWLNDRPTATQWVASAQSTPNR